MNLTLGIKFTTQSQAFCTYEKAYPSYGGRDQYFTQQQVFFMTIDVLQILVKPNGALGR